MNLKPEEILLREYEKCFDFVLHQDRIAWELTSIYLAIQIGLISGISILFSSGKTVTSTAPFQVFVILGTLVSFTWFLILYRNKLWRSIWQLKCLQIEKELKKLGFAVDILTTFYDVLESKYKLVKVGKEIRREPLSVLEKFPTLSVITWIMPVIGFSWVVIYLVIHGIGIL